MQAVRNDAVIFILRALATALKSAPRNVVKKPEHMRARIHTYAPKMKIDMRL